MGSLNIELGTKLISDDKGYLYKDFDINFHSIGGRDVTDSKDMEAVAQSLTNIFTWSKGHRILNPEFGLDLRQFLYESRTPQTLSNIRNEIQSSINKYEPRVAIQELEVVFDEVDDHQVNVTLHFTVPTLSNRVLTFYKPIR